MVLHHVLERADAIVVAGPAFESERLVPDDLDLLDVGAVPDGLEDTVCQARPEYVPNSRHGQEAIDAEHVALVHLLGERAVERSGALEVLTERLLEDHLAVERKPSRVERRPRFAAPASRQPSRETGRRSSPGGRPRQARIDLSGAPWP